MQCYPTTSRRCSEVVGSIRTAEDLEAMASMLRAEKEEVQVRAEQTALSPSGVTKSPNSPNLSQSVGLSVGRVGGQLKSLPIKPT